MSSLSLGARKVDQETSAPQPQQGQGGGDGHLICDNMKQEGGRQVFPKTAVSTSDPVLAKGRGLSMEPPWHQKEA